MIGRKFRTQKARKRERLRVAILSSVGVLSVISLIAGAFYLLQREEFQLREISVETNGPLSVKDVQAFLWNELNNSSFLFMQRTNTLLLSTKGLEDLLRETYPRIRDVSVDRIGYTALQTRIHEREPKALWCGDVVPPIAYLDSETRKKQAEESWGSCYLIDESGYIYARSPVYTGSLFPRYYGSLEQAEPIGQELVASSQFTRWQDFFDLLTRNDLDPVAILFVDERDMEMYLGNGLRVLAGRNDDHEQLIRRLTATLAAGAIDFERTIEYVDLRFGAKVFVRYKEDSGAADE